MTKGQSNRQPKSPDDPIWLDRLSTISKAINDSKIIVLAIASLATAIYFAFNYFATRNELICLDKETKP